MNLMYLARYAQDGPYMMQRSGGEDGWLHGLFGLLMLGLLIAGIVWVAKILVQHSSEPAGNEPIDIAKERYAKGEITKDQLAEIRKELNK